MKTYLCPLHIFACAILAFLPGQLHAELVTYQFEGTADATVGNPTTGMILYQNADFFVEFTIDNTTADQLVEINRGGFANGIAQITIPDAGIYFAESTNVTGLLIDDPGATSVRLVDPTHVTQDDTPVQNGPGPGAQTAQFANTQMPATQEITEEATGSAVPGAEVDSETDPATTGNYFDTPALGGQWSSGGIVFTADSIGPVIDGAPNADSFASGLTWNLINHPDVSFSNFSSLSLSNPTTTVGTPEPASGLMLLSAVFPICIARRRI